MKELITKIGNWLTGTMPLKYKKQTMRLLVIMVSLLAADIIIKVWEPHPSREQVMDELMQDSLAQEKLLSLNEAFLESKDRDTISWADYQIMEKYESVALHEFDPNTASETELEELGLSEKQAGNIIAYRNNGGVFRKPDDLKKIYGIRNFQFRILKPYIAIANQERIRRPKHEQQQPSFPKKERENKGNVSAEKEYFQFDPNSIDMDGLLALDLSQAQAESFLKYQKKKKFYVPEDIADANSFGEKGYIRLKKYITINIDSITQNGKIRDLNTVDKAGLMKCGATDSEADKILDFRLKIKFYYAPWQIKDCIGQKRGNKLQGNFYVCRSVERIKINPATATADELTENPYISADQARRILELRASRSITPQSLVGEEIFSDDEMKRIANYLELKEK